MYPSKSTKATKLFHLTDSVYTFPGDLEQLRPWIGIVITDAGTVLIDSGNGTRHATDIRATLQEMKAPPVSHILLTHHHWDHVFGSCIFPDAYIVAHEQTQSHLQVMAQEPWSPEYVLEKAKEHPLGNKVAKLMNQAVFNWTEFCAIPAHETFQTKYELTLGKYHFIIEHVGGPHEPDQSIIHVTPGNVLFLGDTTYGRGSPRQWDIAELSQILNGFVAREAAWYVEGHRIPASTARFAKRVELFSKRKR